jgi:hypothetical protein
MWTEVVLIIKLASVLGFYNGLIYHGNLQLEVPGKRFPGWEKKTETTRPKKRKEKKRKDPRKKSLVIPNLFICEVTHRI